VEVNILRQLIEKSKYFVSCSVVVLQSADVTGIVHFAVFIRGVGEKFKLVVKGRELSPLTAKTYADEIYSELVMVFSIYKLSW
jgi:hypothetical protein